jgi:hypothetical protein
MVFAHCEFGGATIKLNVVGMPDGGVSVCVTWGIGAISHFFFESFTSEFERASDELLGDN